MYYSNKLEYMWSSTLNFMIADSVQFKIQLSDLRACANRVAIASLTLSTKAYLTLLSGM